MAENRNQGGQQGNQKGNTSNRGLASADEQTREEVARKGGEAVSKDKEHMSEIGKKGGEHSHGGGNQGRGR